MENEFDYYMVESDGAYQSPALMCDDDVDPEGIEYLYDMEKAAEGTVTHLTFRPPYPKKPQMVDYLFLTGRQVFSRKIYDVLKSQEIKGLQWVPAVIRGRKGEKYTDYWVANAYQEYAFLDPDKSDRKGSISADGRWAMINSMVFDNEKVLQVPLDERRVFMVHESAARVLYHKSIVDLIMSVNPIGLQFIPLEKWYNGISYKL
ncbi:hypothetical protein FACS1894178_5150 [Bacteroidia bacterium]|nr:hypothetical protein FACS1894178_5150 [Bacteroidia bacterium]